jgi:hypothetical protein
MLRRLPILILFLAAHALAKEDYRNQPCKTPQLASSCIQMHGRIWDGFFGTPSVRLWQIGTHHVYGIYSNEYGFRNDDTTLDNEGPQLPTSVMKHMPTKTSPWLMYGDFEVCPLESHIQDHMQAACIASATHIVVPKQ